MFAYVIDVLYIQNRILGFPLKIERNVTVDETFSKTTNAVHCCLCTFRPMIIFFNTSQLFR